MSVRPVNPLVRCPRCSSRLIAPMTGRLHARRRHRRPPLPRVRPPRPRRHHGLRGGRLGAPRDARDLDVARARRRACRRRTGRGLRDLALALSSVRRRAAHGAPEEILELGRRQPERQIGTSRRHGGRAHGIVLGQPSAASERGVPGRRRARRPRQPRRPRRERRRSAVPPRAPPAAGRLPCTGAARRALARAGVEHAAEHVAELVLQRAAGRERLAREPRARECGRRDIQVARLAQRARTPSASSRSPRPRRFVSGVAPSAHSASTQSRRVHAARPGCPGRSCSSGS